MNTTEEMDSVLNQCKNIHRSAKNKSGCVLLGRRGLKVKELRDWCRQESAGEDTFLSLLLLPLRIGFVHMLVIKKIWLQSSISPLYFTTNVGTVPLEGKTELKFCKKLEECSFSGNQKKTCTASSGSSLNFPPHQMCPLPSCINIPVGRAYLPAQQVFITVLEMSWH